MALTGQNLAAVYVLKERKAAVSARVSAEWERTKADARTNMGKLLTGLAARLF